LHVLGVDTTHVSCSKIRKDSPYPAIRQMHDTATSMAAGAKLDHMSLLSG
jgi:hypothetical protein